VKSKTNKEKEMQVNRSLIGSLIVVMTLAGCSNSGTKPETSTTNGSSPAMALLQRLAEKFETSYDAYSHESGR
jgi:hypothetical protein